MKLEAKQRLMASVKPLDPKSDKWPLCKELHDLATEAESAGLTVRGVTYRQKSPVAFFKDAKPKVDAFLKKQGYKPSKSSDAEYSMFSGPNGQGEIHTSLRSDGEPGCLLFVDKASSSQSTDTFNSSAAKVMGPLVKKFASFLDVTDYKKHSSNEPDIVCLLPDYAKPSARPDIGPYLEKIGFKKSGNTWVRNDEIVQFLPNGGDPVIVYKTK